MNSSYRIPLAVTAALVVAVFVVKLMKGLPWPTGVPHIGSLSAYAVHLLTACALLALVGGVSLKKQWHAIGLRQDARPSMLMGACLFLPLLAVFLVMQVPTGKSGPVDLAFGAIAAPLFEEVVFRGLATGVLMSFAGWRFWPAALLPAIVFGLAHAAQGQGAKEILAVIAVTGVGGLFFSWLYLRFGKTIWPAFVVHAGLNGMWSAFELGHNAVGGSLGNVARIAVIAGAVAFALKGQPWLQKVSRAAPKEA